MKTRIRVKSGPFEETIYVDEPMTAYAAAVFVVGSFKPPDLGKTIRVWMRGPDGDSIDFVDTVEVVTEINGLKAGDVQVDHE